MDIANIYLQYVLDLWRIIIRVSKETTGRVYLTRYAGDFVSGRTNRTDAEQIWEMLEERLRQFGLELSQEKSRLIEFGKKAYLERERQGIKPLSFDFLGLTHYMARSRKGGLKLGRKTIGNRMRRKLVALNNKLRKPSKFARFVNPFEEPDAVVPRVRFREGPGPTGVWLKYCGAAGKPGGKRRKQAST